MADKTIVFIGDSRVRYQYLDLAWYLKSEQFVKCFDHTYYRDEGFTPEKECLVIFERFSSGWMSFFKQSTDMLETYPTVQRSLCECFRRPTDEADWFERSYENRFTRRMTSHGEINLIYFKSYTNHVRISKNYPPFTSFSSALTSPSKHCEPGECAFEGDVNATLWTIIPSLKPKPTHVFAQLGWEHEFNFATQSEFSCVMKDFANKHPDIKLYLNSHPPIKGNVNNPRATFDATKLKCDIDVFDRSIMTENVPQYWYYDTQHVMSILNEEYNHFMMKMICPVSPSGII